jgi:hypothetical protein
LILICWASTAIRNGQCAHVCQEQEKSREESPTRAASFPSDLNTEPEQNNTQNSEEERMCKAIFDPLWANWALVIVGMGGVLAAVKTLREISSQSEASIRMTQAMVNSERAWLDVKFDPPDGFRYSLFITNHGKSLGWLLGWSVFCRSFPNSEIPIIENFIRVENFQNMLDLIAAGGGVQSKTMDVSQYLTESDRTGKTKALFRVVLRYRDIFDKTVVHTTKLVFEYKPPPDSRMEYQPEYSEYT